LLSEEFNSDTGKFNFKSPDQIPEEFWRAAQEVAAWVSFLTLLDIEIK
jgi:hypothetical protein